MSGDEVHPLPTRVGHVAGDDYYYFGHHVPRELAGEETITGLLALAVCGRRFSRDELQVLDDLAAVLTVADPRIWPLKLARVASAYGDTLPAIAASTLWMEDGPVGFWRCGPIAQMLRAWRAAAVRAAPDDPDSAMETVLASATRDEAAPPGFSIPLRAKDERLSVLRDCLRRRGRDGLPWWSLQETASGILDRRRGLRPHVVVAISAACLDLGLAPEEIGPMAQCLVHHTIVANAVEGARQAPPALRRLPDACIRYAGQPPRTSPRGAGGLPEQGG